MRTEISKRRFTVDEYYQMAEAGILKPQERVELINGEVVAMSPIGNPHMACVDRANAIFVLSLKGRALVSIQSAVQLDIYAMPQPDVLLLKPSPDYYKTRRRLTDDVLLVIEVADLSLDYDREVKRALYAISGVKEYWIEDLQNDLLLVYREPSGDTYKTCLTFGHGETVSPLAFSDLVIPVDELLG